MAMKNFRAVDMPGKSAPVVVPVEEKKPAPKRAAAKKPAAKKAEPKAEAQSDDD